VDLKEIVWHGVDWIRVVQYRAIWRAVVKKKLHVLSTTVQILDVITSFPVMMYRFLLSS
jgi:hypothetical protein